jgi:hypothetical protein
LVRLSKVPGISTCKATLWGAVDGGNSEVGGNGEAAGEHGVEPKKSNVLHTNHLETECFVSRLGPKGLLYVHEGSRYNDSVILGPK